MSKMSVKQLPVVKANFSYDSIEGKHKQDKSYLEIIEDLLIESINLDDKPKNFLDNVLFLADDGVTLFFINSIDHSDVYFKTLCLDDSKSIKIYIDKKKIKFVQGLAQVNDVDKKGIKTLKAIKSEYTGFFLTKLKNQKNEQEKINTENQMKESEEKIETAINNLTQGGLSLILNKISNLENQIAEVKSKSKQKIKELKNELKDDFKYDLEELENRIHDLEPYNPLDD